MCSFCFELFKIQNSKSFQGLGPCTPQGTAYRAHTKPKSDNVAAQRFFFVIPAKILGRSLIMQSLLLLTVVLSKEVFSTPKRNIWLFFFQLIDSKFIDIFPMLLSFNRFMIVSITGEGISSSTEQVCEGTWNRI